MAEAAEVTGAQLGEVGVAIPGGFPKQLLSVSFLSF